MGNFPNDIRFFYARQAPAKANWYTQPDYGGCVIRWKKPDIPVNRYILVRSYESCSASELEEMLNTSMYDGFERLDVFSDITAVVDDQVHDKNRYLILAKLANDDYVCIKEAETGKFVKGTKEKDCVFWSNPVGNEPLPKDPFRLDLKSVKVEAFCGFGWRYPDEYPDLDGFDMIVSRSPISPHTGEESDIEAYQSMLRGEMGGIYSFDKYVNCAVDNVSPKNRFMYYALLARLKPTGRAEIPFSVYDKDFTKSKPFEYFQSDGNGAFGREYMEKAYEEWQAQCSERRILEEAEHRFAEELEKVAGIGWECFKPIPDMSPATRFEENHLIGLQFSAKIPSNRSVIALRAKESLKAPAVILKYLMRAADEKVFFDDEADGILLDFDKNYMTIVDVDCHDKGYYLFALKDKDGHFSALDDVKDLAIDYMPSQPDVRFWGRGESVAMSIPLYCVNTLTYRKGRENNTVELRRTDTSRFDRIELYVLDESFLRQGTSRIENIDKFRSLQLSPHDSIDGARKYICDASLDAFIDDIFDDGQVILCCAGVDENENRYQISLNLVERYEKCDALKLSDILSDPEPGISPEETEHADVDAREAPDEWKSFDTPAPETRRPRFSWDLEESYEAIDDPSDGGESEIIDASDNNDAISFETSVSEEGKPIEETDMPSNVPQRRKARFSWDLEPEDVSSNDEVASDVLSSNDLPAQDSGTQSLELRSLEENEAKSVAYVPSVPDTDNYDHYHAVFISDYCADDEDDVLDGANQNIELSLSWLGEEVGVDKSVLSAPNESLPMTYEEGREKYESRGKLSINSRFENHSLLLRAALRRLEQSDKDEQCLAFLKKIRNADPADIQRLEKEAILNFGNNLRIKACVASRLSFWE